MHAPSTVLTGKILFTSVLIVSMTCILTGRLWAGDLNAKTDFVEFNSETNTALWPDTAVSKSVDIVPDEVGNLIPTVTLNQPGDAFWDFVDDAGVDFKTGVDVNGSAKGDVKLTAKFDDIAKGSIDVNYPVNVSLTWPEPNTFAPGNTVWIEKSFSLVTEGTEAVAMNIVPPKSNVQFAGKFYLEIDLDFDVCLLGDCSIMNVPTAISLSTATLDPSDLNAGVSKEGNYLVFDLLQLNAGQEKIFSPNSTFYIPFIEEALPYTFTPMDGTKMGLSCLRFDRTDTPGQQNCVDAPEISMGSGDLQVIDGHTLSYVNQEDLFVSFRADLDRYLSSKLLTGTPALGITANIPGTGGNGYIQAEGVAIDLDNQLTQKINLEFEPALWLDLAFASEVAGFGYEASTEVVNQNNRFSFVFPEEQKEPMAIGINYRLENVLTASNELQRWSRVKARALDVGYKLPEIKFDAKKWGCPSWLGDVCTIAQRILNVFTKTFSGAEWDPAPVYEKSLSGAQTVSLFNTENISWSLGFPEAPRAAISLNPENPSMSLAKETSKIRNNGRNENGEMSRTAVFAIEVANSGDVPLKNVHIEDLLVATFPAQYINGYRVDLIRNCATPDFPDTFPVNPLYDGSADNAQLLDPARLNQDLLILENTELNVREASVVLDDDGREIDYLPVLTRRPQKSLVVLKATVSPKPYPPLFTNQVSAEGSSWAVGTKVSADSSATLDLGPGKFSGLQDFALFANKKIVLEEMAASQGHLGSQGGIEVHQGDSHTLAGDMHALDSVEIHGQIASDYVFAGLRVNITGQGRLNGKKEADLYKMPEVNQYHDESMLSGLSIGIPAFSAAGMDVLVGANSIGTMELKPGEYGDISVAEGAVLRLTGKNGGAYSMSGLLLRRGSKLLFNVSDGPITLNIVKPLDVAEDVAMSLVLDETSGRYTTTRDVVFNIQEEGHVNIGARARVVGVITAPYAKITLGEESTLDGAAYAEFISVKKGASFRYHDDWYGTLFMGIDADCNGTPDYLEAFGNQR